VDHPEVQAKQMMSGSILIVGYGWNSMARRSVLAAACRCSGNWMRCSACANWQAAF
jgi:hypothetical protein